MRYTLVKNLGIFAAMTVGFAIFLGFSGIMGDGHNILELLGGGFAFSCVFWLPLRVCWSRYGLSEGLLISITGPIFCIGFEAAVYIAFGALFGDIAANILIVLLFIATFFIL